MSDVWDRFLDALREGYRLTGMIAFVELEEDGTWTRLEKEKGGK